MTDLETRLRDTMRRHESAAPTAEDVGVRAFRVRTSRRNPRVVHRQRLAHAAFAALLVPVGIGLIAFLVIHGTQRVGSGSSERGPFTVYLIDGSGSTGAPGLVPTEAAGEGPASSASERATAALRALFAQPPSDARGRNAWAGDAVRSVRRAATGWVVDVARPPTVVGSGSAAVALALQQVAWTVSDATRTGVGVRIDVGGTPLRELAGVPVNTDGGPQRHYLRLGERASGWAGEVCGATQSVLVGPRRYVVEAIPPADRTAPTTVRMRVGQTLRWGPNGLCFQTGQVAIQQPLGMKGTGESFTPTESGTVGLDLVGQNETGHCDYVGTSCSTETMLTPRVLGYVRVVVRP
jgi:hypothetical protein